ncbi:MAG: heavy-metal-associated domain-containing protein [Tannerellaceae bacterium]|nr:heavy-metal-associated domain-containing protein [Tannerellaceae bacterium]
MKKVFRIQGMACGHYRKWVKKALQRIPGLQAVVTLDPPVATIEFAGTKKTPEELQKAVSEAGNYILSETE